MGGTDARHCRVGHTIDRMETTPPLLKWDEMMRMGQFPEWPLRFFRIGCKMSGDQVSPHMSKGIEQCLPFAAKSHIIFNKPIVDIFRMLSVKVSQGVMSMSRDQGWAVQWVAQVLDVVERALVHTNIWCIQESIPLVTLI